MSGRGGRGKKRGSFNSSGNRAAKVSKAAKKTDGDRFENLSKEKKTRRQNFKNASGSKRLENVESNQRRVTEKRFAGAMSRRLGSKSGAAPTVATAARSKRTIRGGFRGRGGNFRGRGGKRGGKRPSVSEETLDKQLNEYMMQDATTAKKMLDAELDEIMATAENKE